jgi:hypothetical protein
MTITYTWIGADGEWGDSSNWSDGLVPDAMSNATIAGSQTETVTVSGTQSVDLLTLDDANATLQISNGASLSAYGGLTAAAVREIDITGGTLLVGGGSQTLDNTTINLSGTLTTDTTETGATLTLGPNLTLDVGIGVIAGGRSDSVVNKGTINVTDYLSVVSNGNGFIASFENQGTINSSFNGIQILATSFNNDSGGNIISSNFYVDTGLGNFTNNGDILINGGQQNQLTWINLDNEGTITVSNGATFNLEAAGGQNNGTISVEGGSRIVFSGDLGGSGSIVIDNGGTLELGSGSLSLTDTISFAGSGTLQLDRPDSLQGEIAGLAAGDAIDFLHATLAGAAVNGTTLTVTYADGETADITLASPLPDGDFVQTTFDGTGGTKIVVTEAPLPPPPTYTWTGTDGDWSDASNWSGGVVPDGTSNATIAGSGTETVTISSSQSVNLLTLDDAKATLAVTNGATLSAFGGLADSAIHEIDIANGTMLVRGGSQTLDNTTLDFGAGDYSSSGTLTTDFPSLFPAETGTVLTLGPNLLVNSAYGVITCGSGSGDEIVNRGTIIVTYQLSISGFGFVNQGEISSGGTVAIYSNNVTNDEGGYIVSNGNFYIGENGGDFLNDGSIFVGGTDSQNQIYLTNGHFDNEGTIAVADGATLYLTDYADSAGDNQNNGTISVSAGSRLIFTGSVPLTGSGSLVINDGGTLELQSGAVAETVNFNGTGTLQLDPNVVLTGAIAGLAVGDTIDFAQGAVTGVDLNGTSLTVTFAGGQTTPLTLAAPLPHGDFLQTAPDGTGGTNIVVTNTPLPPLAVTVNGGQPIGAAISAAVPFTVAGIQPGDNGTVTFSDGTAADNVVVSIVNGVVASSTADLRGLTDGAITATLHLNPNAAGMTFTDVVNIATLDKDAGSVPAGLLGYWSFNGTAADLSDNHNDLSLLSGATYGQGHYGQAVSLDGIQGQGAQEPTDNTAFDFGSGDFTVQVWAKFNSEGGANGLTREETLIEKFSGGAGPGWTLTVQGGNSIEFFAPTTDGGLVDLVAPETIPTGSWQEFVVERSGSTFSLYWDGNLVATADSSAALTASPNDLLIGGRDSADGRNFTVNGLIDDVGVWNRALSSTEITNSWNAGAGYPASVAELEQAALKLIVTTPATGASTVSFVISGLDAEDTGTVTFTDLNGNVVTIAVSGSQTNYTADLHTLANGSITSSLAIATDPAGNAFMPVDGNRVTLQPPPTYTWANDGQSGDWGTASNWTPAGVPDGASNATISGSGTETVTVSSSQAVNVLSLDDVNATLAITGGATLSANSLTNDGNIAAQSGQISVSQVFDNEGSLAVTNGTFYLSDYSSYGSNHNNGVISVGSGGRLIVDGNLSSALSGSGSFVINDGGTLELHSGVVQETVNFTGIGTLQLDANVVLNGAIAGLAVGDGIDFSNAAITNVQVNGTSVTVTFAGGQTTPLTLAAPLLTGDAFSVRSDGDGGDKLVVIVPTPGTPSDSAVIGGYVNADHNRTDQALTGTAEADTMVTIYDNGNLVRAVSADNTGAWSYQIGQLADGSTHIYAVTATDAAGNVSSPSAALSFTVDTSAPDVSWAVGSAAGVEVSPIALGSLVANDTDHNLKSLVISGASAGAVLTDGTNAHSFSGPADSVEVTGWNLSSLSIKAANDANFTLSAIATDAAGNVSSTAAEAVTVSPTHPVLSWATSVSGVQGTSIALGTLGETVTSQTGDSNTPNTLTISGAPAGAVLTDGHGHTHTSAGTADAIDVSGWTLSGLTITPTGDPNFMLTATATEKDADGDISSASTAVEAVNVNPKPPVITGALKQSTHWNLSGTADANTTVTIYNNGTKVGTTTANSTGGWSFSNAGGTGTVDKFTATDTDAGKVSAASAAWIEGTTGNDTFTFNSEPALAAVAALFGNGGTDTISMTAPVTLSDADFAHVVGVAHLQMAGASSASLGADAASAGIGTVITGSGATAIADIGGTALTVNAAALANNTTLTLSGSTAETVTGLIGDISATGLTGKLTVTAAQNNVDHGVAIALGSAATSITDSFSTDTVTVDASALANNTVLTLSGSASVVVTGLIGDIVATNLTGSLTVTAAQNNVDHGISIQTGSGKVTITDSFSADTVSVTGTSGANTIVLSGGASFIVTGGGGADTMTGGSGHNTYKYGATSDSKPSASDTITNFNAANDKIGFSAISGLNSTVQNVGINFLTATPSSIAAHTIDVVTFGGNTIVYANASGSSETISNGHEDMLIHLTGVGAGITASDFILHA